jgi:DNA-binding NarL/FixJ family response regulator
MNVPCGYEFWEGKIMKHQLAGTGRTAVLMDPHPFCHTAIASLLTGCNTRVVGSATTASCTNALLEEHSPDVLVAELELPEGRKAALSLITRARRANPALTVIVLSGVDDAELIDAAFEAGASAYILKTTDPDCITTAIQQAFEPSIYLARPRETKSAVATATRVVPQLTRRELEILRLVSEGRSNRQVGQVLWVTDQTVKFHLANIYRKLGVGSRYDAARWAQEHGVLDVALEAEDVAGEVVSIGGTTANGDNTDNGHRNGNGNGNGNGSHTGNGHATRPTQLRLRRSTRLAPRDGLREGTSQ